jgi:hypothetical protein
MHEATLGSHQYPRATLFFASVTYVTIINQSTLSNSISHDLSEPARAILILHSSLNT